MAKRGKIEEIRKFKKAPSVPTDGHDALIEDEELDVEQKTARVLSMKSEKKPVLSEKELRQKKILDQLRNAKNAESRVRTFATIMDTYGVDAIIDLVPGAGDALTSSISGLYLMYEAKKAGLSKSDYIKIIGLQAADFFVGAIPIVGDVADFFFKANKMSVPLFKDRTKELVRQARTAGVSEDAIAKITTSADKLPQLVDHAVHLHKISRVI